MVLRLLAERCHPQRVTVTAPSARAVATSSAALEATPTEAGRSDVISIRPQGGSITPWRSSTSATPIT